MTRASSDKEGKKAAVLAKTSEMTASAVIAATGTTAATGSLTAGGLAGLFAILPPIIGTLIPGFASRQKRRAEGWWSEIISHEGSNDQDEDFEEELRHRILDEDENALATIMESLRKLLESLEPTTVVPLARLTRSYLKKRKPPDLFFRGAADVLSRVSAVELSSLQVVLDAAIAAPAAEVGDEFVKLLHRAPGNPHGNLVNRGTKGSEIWSVGYFRYESNKAPVFEPLQEAAYAREVFALLKGARLADDNRGAYGETAGPDDLLIEREVARRFRELL